MTTASSFMRILTSVLVFLASSSSTSSCEAKSSMYQTAPSSGVCESMTRSGEVSDMARFISGSE
jgi:hypothetical protein